MKHKRDITPRQARFVAEYLKDSHAERAAIAAGYARKHAAQQATRMLRECPAVMEAVKSAREAISAKGIYNLEVAMERLEERVKFAIEKGHPMAAVRAEELMMKLNGLLIDKIHLQAEIVDVSGALNEARARVAPREVGPTLLSSPEDPGDIFE